jgi:hypothetical protein
MSQEVLNRLILDEAVSLEHLKLFKNTIVLQKIIINELKVLFFVQHENSSIVKYKEDLTIDMNWFKANPRFIDTF